MALDENSITQTKTHSKKPRIRQRTDRAWFSRLLQNLARKRSGSILSTPEPAGLHPATKRIEPVLPTLHGPTCARAPKPTLGLRQIRRAAIGRVCRQTGNVAQQSSLGLPASVQFLQLGRRFSGRRQSSVRPVCVTEQLNVVDEHRLRTDPLHRVAHLSVTDATLLHHFTSKPPKLG